MFTRVPQKNVFLGQINLERTGIVQLFPSLSYASVHTAALQGSLGMDFLNLFGHRTLFERTDETPPTSLLSMGTQSGNSNPEFSFELSGGGFMDEKTCPRALERTLW